MLALRGENDLHIAGFAEMALRGVGPVQAEVRHGHRHALEALPRRVQPRVKLAVHHVTEILPQPVPFGDHRRPPIERRGRADETMMVDMHEPGPPRCRHVTQEVPRLIDEIPIAVNHVRLRLFQQRQHLRQRSGLEPVVRVEPHHPVAARALEPLVDRVGHPLVGFLCPYRVGKPRRHRRAVIRRPAVDDQMF